MWAKSTLFNKLIGERRAIVEDTPGVTRDRIYGETEWRGVRMTVIDTGGIEPKTDDVILAHMRMQAEIAIDTADVIVFLCDVRTGPTADDREIAVMLKKSRKPVVVAVNKCDSVGATPPEFYEFYEFGFDSELVALSSVHGTGTGDLLDEIYALLPEGEAGEDPDEGIKVAVIGKPNAGKSSRQPHFGRGAYDRFQHSRNDARRDRHPCGKQLWHLHSLSTLRASAAAQK